MTEVYQPPFPYLTGSKKDSFAYVTLKDRLPIISTKTIDTLSRYLHALPSSQQNTINQGTRIISTLASLRNELQCNKQVSLLQNKIPFIGDQWNELDCWNELIGNQFKDFKWFELPWLVSECLVYRRIADAFVDNSNNTWWINYDWFGDQKIESLDKALTSLSSNTDSVSSRDFDEFFDCLLKSLWGNQNDLSIHAGRTEDDIKNSIHSDLESASCSYLLANHAREVYEYLASIDSKTVYIILDNCGPELLMDLQLADYLITSKFATKIVFHVKVYPWFISDVVENDFYETLDKIKSIGAEKLVFKWQQYLNLGKWAVNSDIFYNMFYAYADIPLSLLDNIKKDCSLLILKGDLNYRKLVYDCEYPFDTPFSDAIGLKNIPLLALRTCKSDVVVGLKSKDSIDKSDLVTGKYGVIQFNRG